MANEQITHSIVLRLRRVVYEDAYVAVPVTDTIIKTNEAGEGKIDFELFVAEAIRFGSDPRVEWKAESTSMEAHPLQVPTPDDRQSFDAFQSASNA
jgi:hypothetical protein